MTAARTDVEAQLTGLLRTAKASLGLSVTFLSRMDEESQVLELVQSSIPLLFQQGYTQDRKRTFCQAILDGRLPAVIPDVKALPEAMKLPAARFPRIRSFVSVPVVLSDGSLYGTFCGAGLTSDKGLSKRDKALMDILAHAAAVIIEPGVRERARTAEIEARLVPVIDAGGPLVLLQPIVELATGLRIGAEALSRFPAAWDMAPDVVFAQAHSVDLGHRLELLALAGAAAHLDTVEGYVAMNVSPATLLTPGCAALLAGLPLPRVVLELSEHDQGRRLRRDGHRPGTARSRRVAYQWKFRREQHNTIWPINAMIERAEEIADGRAPMRKARFLKITEASKVIRPGDQATIDRGPSAGRPRGLRHEPADHDHGRRRRDRGLPRPRPPARAGSASSAAPRSW